MPDSSIPLVHEIWTGAKWLGLALLGVITWSVRREIKRVDDIEGAYISKETFNGTLGSIRDDIKYIRSRIDNIRND